MYVSAYTTMYLCSHLLHRSFINIMIFHMSVHSTLLLQKTPLTVWRTWRSWKLLHSSVVGASSGPGSLGRPKELSSVSTEKPLHTPVMLKEVLHFLDIQPGQVCCLSICANVLMLLRKLMSVFMFCHKQNVFNP